MRCVPRLWWVRTEDPKVRSETSQYPSFPKNEVFLALEDREQPWTRALARVGRTVVSNINPESMARSWDLDPRFFPSLAFFPIFFISPLSRICWLGLPLIFDRGVEKGGFPLLGRLSREQRY